VITRAQWRSHLENQPPSEIPEGIATRANTPHEADIRWAKNAQMLPAPFMDEDSDGTFLARSAIRFMDEQQGDRFFLWVAFHEPHAPFNFPVEYAGSYDPREVPLPEGSDEDQRWVPEIFRDLTEAERRGIISSYYTSVEYMDKNVGLILDAMEDRGLDQETLVVYLSDHGYLLNEHSRFEKHSMWAESIKAPLIFRGSGIQQGTESNALAEFVDLTPTIYAAMGLPMHDGLQGQSLLPILQGGDDELRAYAFAEYLEDNMAMVASRRWKYIFTTGKRDLGLGYSTGQGPSGVVHMLYNLENDPRETSNLAYNTAFLPMVDSLQQVMLDHFLNTHPNAGYVPSGLNTVGKLIWFCEPTDVGEEPGGELQRIFEKEDIYQ
jgi:arylsulfatase A-like enzyme